MGGREASPVELELSVISDLGPTGEYAERILR